MSAATTRLNLTKPGGGSTGLIMPPDPVDIDVLNANFDKIDASMGFKVVTSVTRPAGPFDGQPIFETDTKQIRVFRQAGAIWDAPGYGRGGLSDYLVANLAALDTITDATIGDSAWMTTPGTGIDPMRWRAYAGVGGSIDWQPADTIIAATKANLDAFIAAVAAIPDLRFQVGARAVAYDTGITYAFTSTAGAYRTTGGLVPIRPSSVAGTGVTVAADGTVSFSGSSPNTVSVNGVFTDDFKNYLVKLEQVAASAGVLGSMRLRAGGTDQSSAVYDVPTLYGQNGAPGSGTSVAQTSAGLYSGILVGMDVNFDRPKLNTHTLVRIHEIVSPNPGTVAGMVMQSLGFLHRSNYQADGFSMVLANVATGVQLNANIYGYGGPA